MLQFDHSPDQECGSVLPVQLLYDDGHEGSVAGFTRWRLILSYFREISSQLS